MIRIILLVAALLAFPVLADTPPQAARLANGCYEFLMCTSQSTAADCTDPTTGDEITKDLGGFYNLTILSTESTATAYTCDFTTASQDHDSGGGTSHVTVSGAQVTATSEGITLEGHYRHSWFTCSTVTGGNVEIKLTACPVER